MAEHICVGTPVMVRFSAPIQKNPEVHLASYPFKCMDGFDIIIYVFFTNY